MIVPFYQEIVTLAILSNLVIDVFGIFAIIWFPVRLAFENNRTLMGSLAGFFWGLLLSPFFMACGAIDLCFNLIVLLLSPITRSLATIGHMLSYAFSGANASTHDSNAGLTNR